MLTKLPLRSKLILVVSIPLFVILGFATFGMAGRMSDLDAQRQYGRLRGPNDALTAVASNLETEGVLTTWADVSHAPDVTARLTRARKATDQAVGLLAGSGAALAEGNVAPGTLDSWRTLVGRLRSTINSTRNQVDGRTAEAANAGATFLDLGNDTLAVSELVARDLSNRDLSASMLGLVDLRREQLESAREAEIVLPFVVTGQSDQLANWVSAITAQRADVAKFRAAATPAARAAFEKVRATPPPQDLMRDPTSNTLPTAFTKTVMSPDFYFSVWQAKEDYLGRGIGAVQKVTDSKASALESDALNGVLWYGLGVSALVLLVLVLTWITIRSVNRSLRVLTAAAQEVAEERLPHLVDTLAKGGEVKPGDLGDITPIKVTSKDELGELATAFNTIQRVAVSVAEEQSALLRKGIGDLYVNLARRNQSLLDRQIALLDDMEARAEDSEYLGSLFELDHLATRMRRNAESLLVMSGAEQPRQWHESIPMLDVVRAATAEITDFARVGYYGFEGEVAVAGNAVADVTHLLAELLENATVFSPPGTPVIVTGMRAERRYVISITDEGIGMADDRLAAANALLKRPPATGLALSRTLGLHVVGNLATRYGITAQLRRSATGGITAVVALPAKVLARLARPEDMADERDRYAPEGPVVAVPVDDEGSTESAAFFDRALEAVIEAPTTERPVFEPVFDSQPDAGFEPVAPPYDHEVDPQIDARPGRSYEPATAPNESVVDPVIEAQPVGRVAPEALVFTAEAVFVGSPPAASESIDWQPAFTAESRPSAAGSAPTPPPAPAPTPPPAPAATEHPAPPPTAVPMPAPAAGPVAQPTGTRAGGQEIPLVESTPLSRRVPGAAFGGTPDPAAAAPTPQAAPTAERPPTDPRSTDRPPTSGSGLKQRTPGQHLSHKPAPPSAPRLDGEPRPRPERVHDLLARHLRGIREGRTGVTHADDHADERAGMEDDR